MQGGTIMPDMLIKLYDLDDYGCFITDQKKMGVTIRKPIGPEKHVITDWISAKFSPGWAAEADTALSNRPGSCFVATRESQIVGFACYDATALGFFGPVGVAEADRGKGTGSALLKACLLDMKLKGYGYAIVGDVNDPGYYTKIVSAIEIPGSSPGVYENRIIKSDSHI
jgi:predicted N-acetyltransferase YhbS